MGARATFSILLSDRTIATKNAVSGWWEDVKTFQYPTLGSNHRYPGQAGDPVLRAGLSVSYSRIEPSLQHVEKPAGQRVDRPFSILLSDRTIATIGGPHARRTT